MIVRVASNGHGIVNRADKWSDGTARLKRIAMTSKWLKNLESDVTGTNPNVLSIANAKIDVANIGAI